jgi:hypothetical protein
VHLVTVWQCERVGTRDNPGRIWPVTADETTARTAADVIRELLYGDVELARWGANDPVFDAARVAVEAGDTDAALLRLYSILGDNGRQSRDRLQAWHELRRLGEEPLWAPRTYGVVMDTPVDAGLDTLAAYQDRTCRYVNHAGGVLIWEAPDDSVQAEVDAVIDAGVVLAMQSELRPGPRPPLRPGLTRLSLLCEGGLRLREGEISTLEADPQTAPLLAACLTLLQALVATTGAGAGPVGL